MITRKQFLSGALLSVVAVPVAPIAAEPTATQADRPKAKPAPKRLVYTLRVIAADTLQPLPDVEIQTVYAGRGADGGYCPTRTDQNGMAEGVVVGPTADGPGVWQIYLNPPKGSKYRYTSFTTPETMLTVLPDGTYFPDTFRLALKGT
jgi:hypothetical protein